jgi:flagella basal body P-ring formation protein FlgA
MLDAGRVQAAARAAGLTWANPTGLRRITVRSGAAAETASTVAGKAETLVYARSLRAGEVVGAEDVVWAAVAAAPADAPGDAEAVIGLEARRPLRAGSPVAVRDLASARVIRKDDAVAVRFRSGGVNVALKGTALNAASQGELVRVMNTQSKTVVEAVAAGPGLAVVGPEAEALKRVRLANR